MASTVKLRTACLHIIINCTNDKKCACTCACFFPYLRTFMQKDILHQNGRKKAFPFGVCNLGKGNLLSQAIPHFLSLSRINQKKPQHNNMPSGLTVRTTTPFPFLLPFVPCPHPFPPPPEHQQVFPTSQTPVCRPLGCSPCVEPFLRK